MIRLFKGTCLAVAAMHDYRGPAPKSSSPGAAPGNKVAPVHNRKQANPDEEDEDDEDEDEDNEDDEDDEDEEDEEELDQSKGPTASTPLVTKKRAHQTADVVFGSTQEPVTNDGSSTDQNIIPIPYAHRDIKPGNVMISDEGEPILMDFGSTLKARISITTRQIGLAQQDLAAEQSTMSYRAPELFDVKTGTTLDEKVDIWSLGCMLYAMAYGHSPFETNQTLEQGGSMALAVMNAQYKHPAGTSYLQGLRDLIDFALKADPAERPNIHQLIARTDQVLQSLR